MQAPPLAQSIGAAERSMRALLDRRLAPAGLSFPEWTILVLTSRSPLRSEQLARLQLDGLIVERTADTDDAIRRLTESGLLALAPGCAHGHTQRGAAVFAELSAQLKAVTAALCADLPADALDATHRTLTEIAARARRMLAP